MRGTSDEAASEVWRGRERDLGHMRDVPILRKFDDLVFPATRQELVGEFQDHRIVGAFDGCLAHVGPPADQGILRDHVFAHGDA